ARRRWLGLPGRRGAGAALFRSAAPPARPRLRGRLRHRVANPAGRDLAGSAYYQPQAAWRAGGVGLLRRLCRNPGYPLGPAAGASAAGPWPAGGGRLRSAGVQPRPASALGMHPGAGAAPAAVRGIARASRPG
nr:hypothetical protein [Tanacetum cinerariifolium]